MRRIVLAACVVARRRAAGRRSRSTTATRATRPSPGRSPRRSPSTTSCEAKAEGDLSYPDMRRAKWFALDLPGQRRARPPPRDHAARRRDQRGLRSRMEVLDPGYRVISKIRPRGRGRARADQGQDAARSASRQVPDPPLPPGPDGHRRLRAPRGVQAHRGRRGARATSRRRSRSSPRCRWCRSTTTRRSYRRRPPQTVRHEGDPQAAPAQGRRRPAADGHAVGAHHRPARSPAEARRSRSGAAPASGAAAGMKGKITGVSERLVRAGRVRATNAAPRRCRRRLIRSRPPAATSS